MNTPVLDFDPMTISLEEAKLTPRGILIVSGWAAGYTPVDKIDIIVGEHILGTPEIGRSRPDVHVVYPDYASAEASGFFFQAEIDDAQLTVPEARVRVTLQGGVTRTVSKPISMPMLIRRQAPSVDILYCCEMVALSSNGFVTIKGWAASSSIVSEIEIYIDGKPEPIGTVIPGLLRPDVGNVYPSIPSARNSGFSFEKRLDSGNWVGEHLLTLLIRTQANTSLQVPFPVLVEENLDESSSTNRDLSLDEQIRFNIDTPSIKDGMARERVRGALTLVGWAIARAGIASIDVLLDNAKIGNPYLGSRRADIAAAFPDWEDVLLSGFAITIPRRVFTGVTHHIRVVVTDKDGKTREMEFNIEVDSGVDESGAAILRDHIHQFEIDLKSRLITASAKSPGFTIAVLVEQDAVDRINQTLKSLRAQYYQDYKILLVTQESVAASLDELATEQNLTIVNPTNDPILVAQSLDCWSESGRRPFFMMLRAGDCLGTDALLELALELTTHDHADFVYADDIRYDPAQQASAPFCKPEWSPDLLLSSNYIGRPWCAAFSTLQAANIQFGELLEFGEYDLVLRLTEYAQEIRRVPLLLAARREREGDTQQQELSALSRALLRRSINGEILEGCIDGVYRLKRCIEGNGMISIIMPTIAARGLVEISIASIRKLSHYRNFEIICIDNIKDPDSDWKPWLRQHADIVVEVLEPFNWSRFNNIGAEAAHGEFLLFLNDDIEVLDPYWLDALLEHAQRDEVGVVGPQLLYPDRRVQHAGIFLTNAGGRHAFRFTDENEPGPFGLARSQRNIIAVTGACMLMRRAAYDAVGGFNEAHSVVNNDLDYCLRAWQAGQRVIFTPYTKLIHHELASRAKMDDVFDTSGFDADWRLRFLLGDPYFHPRLSLDDDNYLVDQEPTVLITTGHPILAREKVKRILVQKLDHIGDFITALPAIRRLQERFPKAEIHALVPKSSLSLTHLEPSIVNAIEFNFFHAISGLGKREVTEVELEELQTKLAPYEFDLAIDLRKLGDTRHVLKYTGARMLAGFDFRGENPWLDVALEWEGDTVLARKRAHVADEYLSLVETVSIACDSSRTVSAEIVTGESASDALAAFPKMAEITRGLLDRRYVCIHPASGNDARQWPPNYFAGLIDLLLEYCDVNVAIIGAESEREIAYAVLEKVSRCDRVWSLVGKTGMRDIPNVIYGSALFVGNNSGPHHLAAALGVPTIGIHSGIVDAIEWGPFGVNAIALQKRMFCSPCYLPSATDCHRNLACLRELRPIEVFRQCEQLLCINRPGIPGDPVS